ncbi:MAG: flagellar basal body rod protein FlgG [Legionella sp.]|nr:MAG: flagellar basal body rod protein FlgG [Legionella sp.]PJD96961.1 MAG: flagellar basal body rod protein FlgG [Legionella sp.]
MSDALAIAASGLKSEELYINNIANDLANLNTADYKATRLTFEDVLYQNIQTNSPSATQTGLGTAVYKSSKDFTPGPLKPSNNEQDVAINGVGFYQVMMQDGTFSYSRSSSLSIDSDHYLSTHEGLRLADNIQIPDDYKQLIIQKNGDVEVLVGEDNEPQLIGTIQLARFTNPEGLHALGSGLYTATPESGEAFSDIPGSNGLGELAQKQIEGSNVDMVGSLMQLTMAQRVYQLNAKAAQIADELERLTNEIRN